jgi:hypothetical protein
MSTKKPLAEIIKIVEDTNQYATMYTKEDVLRVLADVQEEVTITQAQRDDLKRRVRNAVENIEKDSVCEDFEFDIRNGNEIEVSDFNFNSDSIVDDVWYEVDSFLDEVTGED